MGKKRYRLKKKLHPLGGTSRGEFPEHNKFERRSWPLQSDPRVKKREGGTDAIKRKALTAEAEPSEWGVQGSYKWRSPLRVALKDVGGKELSV